MRSAAHTSVLTELTGVYFRPLLIATAGLTPRSDAWWNSRLDDTSHLSISKAVRSSRYNVADKALTENQRVVHYAATVVSDGIECRGDQQPQGKCTRNEMCWCWCGDMAPPRRLLWLLATLGGLAVCGAGPLGPLPNVTSMDLGLKEGGCAVGDVVYMPGDEFPGEGPCERCSCARGGVRCARQSCAPRPGCKALHRPDHCCPTYQCECVQEGRVYDNGEKLVDPADPCRVCYCQGGEVVCRRIACFVRDDCTPRRVPGRCCPEYDNCPLRGVTTISIMAPAVPNIPAFEEINTGVVPSAMKEPIKQEITIKEITPVSEIPVITEVKIKEILPSPSIDVAEYSSSKSPLITREVTSEKSQMVKSDNKQESPELTNSDIPSSPVSLSPLEVSKPSDENGFGTKSNDAPPSKISLSTQDSINSNIYTSSVPSAAVSGGSPSMIPNVVSVPSSKAPMIEEEDTSLFDHNPAFPPLPDDLSVSGNHEEEILTEQNMDNEHPSGIPEIVIVASTTATSTEAVVTKDAETTASSFTFAGTTVGIVGNSRETTLEGGTTKSENGVTVETTKSRESSMLNLRSVMSTETINLLAHLGSSVELSDATEAPATTSTSNQHNVESNDNSNAHFDDDISTSTDDPDSEIGVAGKVTDSEQLLNAGIPQEQTTSSVSKVNTDTDVTSQTELSSLPVETSDQNPHDSSENITIDKESMSSNDPLILSESITKLWPAVTESKTIPSDGENQSFENMETTEYVSSSFGSQESTTAGVELIKISTDSKKNSALIDQSNGRNNNVLTDLINLVGDVASIGDHNEASDSEHHTASPTTISDSEELIPVNAGYKSKNKNWNSNSITEVPTKTRPANKQKNVEIEDDDSDSDSITDSPPPNDKAEPTTRRPLIDNVSDGGADVHTEKKDIEIITQSYVPTLSRRPTKVIMKKERPAGAAAEAAAGGVTENDASSDEVTAAADAGGAPAGSAAQ